MLTMRRLTMVFALAGLAAAGLVLGACGGGNGGDPAGQPGQELRSDLQRITAPDVGQQQLAAQVAANNRFAFELYHQLVAGDENLFFSPHSIEVALAMTWAGARGETESAMAEALNFELGQAELHPVFNALDLELNDRGEGAEGSDGEGFRLNVINSIWGQTGYTFMDAFLDTLALHYGAGLRLLDFWSDPDAAGEQINLWVEQVTEQRIQDLIPPGTLSAYTKLVLVNAIYFNAAWQSPFDEDNTRDAAFHTAAGSTVEVPMMHQQLECGWAEGLDYQAVELPYDGGQLAMLVLVPELGSLDEFEQRLDGAFIEDLHANMQWGMVELAMPRWEYDGETIKLVEPLKALGMGIAFENGQADFSGINGRHDLFIHNVLHQAFVKVNEKGTEAAAATAVIVGDVGIPPQGPAVTLDRPFIYLIQDRPTGQILFLGRVTDPS
jgi:serpin B